MNEGGQGSLLKKKNNSVYLVHVFIFNKQHAAAKLLKLRYIMTIEWGKKGYEFKSRAYSLKSPFYSL